MTDAEEFLTQRKTAYQLTFEKEMPANVDVLIDLARFCRANETTLVNDKTGKLDVEKSIALAARRDVWLRIQQHLGLTPEQLLALYSGNALIRRTS